MLLNALTAMGLLTSNFDESVKIITERFANVDLLVKQKVHPMDFLIAAKVYSQGHGMKGKLSWTPVPAIVDALNDGFYDAFKAVEPTGKNFLLAVDVSASMGWNTCGGIPITPREAAGAFAMVTAKTEKNHQIVAVKLGLAGGKPSGKVAGIGSIDHKFDLIFVRLVEHALQKSDFIIRSLRHQQNQKTALENFDRERTLIIAGGFVVGSG